MSNNALGARRSAAPPKTPATAKDVQNVIEDAALRHHVNRSETVHQAVLVSILVYQKRRWVLFSQQQVVDVLAGVRADARPAVGGACVVQVGALRHPCERVEAFGGYRSAALSDWKKWPSRDWPNGRRGVGYTLPGTEVTWAIYPGKTRQGHRSWWLNATTAKGAGYGVGPFSTASAAADEQNKMNASQGENLAVVDRYGKLPNGTTWHPSFGAAPRPDVTATILRQLGGINRLGAMIGAANFISYGPVGADKYGEGQGGVSFRFSNPGAGKPNYVKIVLDADDTYTVTFGRVRGRDYKAMAPVHGIYTSNLKALFERTTGVYLSLFGGAEDFGGVADIIPRGRRVAYVAIPGTTFRARKVAPARYSLTVEYKGAGERTILSNASVTELKITFQAIMAGINARLAAEGRAPVFGGAEDFGAARTFKAAQADIFAYLRANGWTVRDNLKVPWAEPPGKSYRLWFKAQAVYLNEHSLHVDIRDLSPAQFMVHVSRVLQIRAAP